MSFWYQYQVCLISDWKYSAFYFYSNRNPYFKFCLFNFYVTQQIKLNYFVKLELFSRYNSLKVAISIELKPFFKCLWFSAAHHWDQSRIPPQAWKSRFGLFSNSHWNWILWQQSPNGQGIAHRSLRVLRTDICYDIYMESQCCWHRMEFYGKN